MNRRLLILLAVLALLAVIAPNNNPVFVQDVNAATYPYTRYATWHMDDPVLGGGFFRVKASASWTTKDPGSTCYDNRRWAEEKMKTPQSEVLDIPGDSSKCANPLAHEFYTAAPSTRCWVATSNLYSIVIDECGPIDSWWNYPNYFYTIGVRFRVCMGIINTPFSLCDGYTSELHVSGSMVWAKNYYSG